MAEEHKRSFNPHFAQEGKLSAELPHVTAAMRRARGIMNRQIEDSALVVADRMADHNAYNAWKVAKRNAEALLTVKEAAEHLARKGQVHNLFSLTEWIAGATAAGLAGSPLVGIATGLGGMALRRFNRLYGNAMVSDLANRASKIGSLQGAAGSTTRKITDGISGFIKALDKSPTKYAVPFAVGVSGGMFVTEKKPTKIADRQAAYETTVDQLSSIIANPVGTTQKLTTALAEIHPVAPNVSTQMARTVLNAAQFLHDKAPKNPDELSILGSQWKPNERQLSAFERYVTAVQNPLAIIEGLKHGYVSSEGVETLKVVYPAIYNEVIQTILPSIHDKKTLPIARRMQLSTLLGAPIDSTSTPELVAAIQGIHGQSAAAGQQAPPRPSTRKSSFAAAVETPFQRIASRNG